MLKNEIMYSESTVKEVEYKLANLMSDLQRVVDQVQKIHSQLASSKSGQVEYFMSPAFIENVAKIQSQVTFQN